MSRALIPIAILLLIFCAPFSLCAQNSSSVLLEKARNEETQGNREEALSLYSQWLNANPHSNSMRDVLFHAVSLCPAPSKALEFLETHTEKLSGADRGVSYERMADLESSLGLLEKSTAHYEKAAALGNAADSERRRLKALVIRFSMGQYSRVETQGLLLSEKTNNSVLRVELMALTSLCAALQGKTDEALAMVNEAVSRSGGRTPLPLLSQLDISRMAGAAEVYKKALTALSGEYPDSVAAYLANAQVKRWASPMFFESFQARMVQGHPVQAGAFLQQTGAAALREELENAGFTAWMDNSDGIWRVFIHNSDGNAAERLAEWQSAQKP